MIGRVVAPWGVRGELKVEVMTDFPDRFSPREELYADGRAFIIEQSRWHKGKVILKLAAVDGMEAAEELRGKYLEVPQSSMRPLPQDEYYQFQLIGLEVWTTEGVRLGSIERILPTGSNDVYEVPCEGGVALIPAIDDVVKSVDLQGRRMIIEVIEGLLPQQGSSRKEGTARRRSS